MLVARPLRPDRPSKPVMRSVLLSLALSTFTGPFAFAAVPAQLEAVAPRAYEIGRAHV